MGLYKVRLFYDQRAENAITDIGAWRVALKNGIEISLKAS
jgi:hypothetical protein